MVEVVRHALRIMEVDCGCQFVFPWNGIWDLFFSFLRFDHMRSVSNSATWGWQVQEFHKVSSRHFQAPHADISQHLLTWSGELSILWPPWWSSASAGRDHQGPPKFTPLTRDDQAAQMATTDWWFLRWRNNDGTGEKISM